MQLSLWLELSLVALLTSAVSGVMGMAGGMLLLTIMLLRLDPALVIPIHGVVQLVSNASRAFLLRDHMRWPVVWRFAWPLVPAGALGCSLLSTLPEGGSRVLIGVFTLTATWTKAFFRIAGGSGARALPVGGALVGFFSVLVGATGPLLAPFVVALELTAKGTIATLAACQVLQHAVKVALFGVLGFDVAGNLLPCALLCCAAIAGSMLGTRLLDRIPEKPFRLLIKLVLTALALSQIWQGAF